ncbi:hypothetical protein B0T26DRAFT_751970 [Lasiosphaeria miniovina]|uniref:Uncharacterized protein n=1 Tax=Lasiosphaeria miniovina TaxID=1954250 RepID=A0AA40DY60_9PEZI|nr:uncharacterized protein B0T26DRAFT_751970 [Lasiosphaeria miniovina]KAK0717982.1 hypothetical protein B0T26DRAFT_751970 [Lasiosphaeria miniovina]
MPAKSYTLSVPSTLAPTSNKKLQSTNRLLNLRGLLRPFRHGGPLKPLSDVVVSFFTHFNKAHCAAPFADLIINSAPVVSAPVDSVASPLKVVKYTKATIQESRITIQSQSFALTHTEEKDDFHIVASSTFDQSFERHLQTESGDRVYFPEPITHKSEQQLVKEKLVYSWTEAHATESATNQTTSETLVDKQQAIAKPQLTKDLDTTEINKIQFSSSTNGCSSATSSGSRVWSEPSVADADNTDLGGDECAGDAEVKTPATGNNADEGASVPVDAEEHPEPSDEEDPSDPWQIVDVFDVPEDHARPGPPGSLVLYGLGSNGLVYWYRPNDDLYKAYMDQSDSSSSFVSDPDDEDQRSEDEENVDHDECQYCDEDEYEHEPEDQVPPTGLVATSWGRHSFIDEDGFNLVEPSLGPELKLTTPDGGECWPEDITQYEYDFEYVPSEDEAEDSEGEEASR